MQYKLLTTTHLTAIGYNSGDQGTTVTLPVGRIVWGHPSKPKPATDNNNQPKIGSDGQQLMETSFGLAIPQDQFTNDVWPHMAAEIAKGFPNGAPGNFSYKMTQPHEIDNKGKPYSEREGYAGHVVLAVSTTLEPPPVFKWDGQRWQQMQPDEIKCGDYVQVEINFKVNVPRNNTHTPSIYVNPRGVAFVGYGAAIQTGFQIDPNQAFGNGPPPLPPGASATPIGGNPGVGMPGIGGAQQPQGGMPGNAPMGHTAGGAPGSSMPGHQAGPPSAAPAPNAGMPQQQPGNMPPPATGFVDQAAQGQGGMPGQMPGAPTAGGMPGAMPPR